MSRSSRAARRESFNPPPAVRPGESTACGYAVDAFRVFQSAPGGEAGGKRGLSFNAGINAVSIRPRR